MGNPLTLYHTTTGITAAELALVLDKGQRLLADLAISSGYQKQMGQKMTCECFSLQLYLYLYAIQSWDITPNALNFFDQPALIRLLSKVEQLFYICNFKPAC